ncbi:hypothetical protein STENM36S_09028 [Streptomyces tendae]
MHRSTYGAEVDPHPLRVGGLAGPAGAGVAVEGRGGRCPGVLDGGGGGGSALRGVGRVARAARGAAAGGAEDLELPQGVAPGGGPVDALHTDVAALARDVERVGAAVAAGDRLRVGPGAPVLGELDLVVLAVGRLPVEHHPGDGGGGAEVDLEPLVVARGRRPPGGRVAVDGVAGGRRGVLGRRRRGRPALGEGSVGRGGRHRCGEGDERRRGDERDTQGSQSHAGAFWGCGQDRSTAWRSGLVQGVI